MVYSVNSRTHLVFLRINSGLTIEVFTTALTPDNALDLLCAYDVILDCTDNIQTRYLLSDAAVALGKPLVSGAAQKFEGQLCVFNSGQNGPCYRCLYPVPPPTETVGSCAELGILGVVTGTIGNLQSLETIKIILGLSGTVQAPFHFISYLSYYCRSQPIVASLQCNVFPAFSQH